MLRGTFDVPIAVGGRKLPFALGSRSQKRLSTPASSDSVTQECSAPISCTSRCIPRTTRAA